MIWVYIGIAIFVFLLICFIIASNLYKIVPPSEAHIVTTPSGKFVASSDESIGDKKWYFAIPEWIPLIGRQVREMDITTKEMLDTQMSYEKGQGRYSVKTSTKFRVNNVKIAAETWSSYEELKGMLKEIVKASVRAVTINYDVENARAKQQEIENGIKKEIDNKFAQFGLNLVTFQLIDFEDIGDSTIVSDISKKREAGIRSVSEQEIAEKEKAARIKKAEADKAAQQKEIERDREVGEYKQDQEKAVAIKEQQAQKEIYEVKRVQTIEQAEIDKRKAEIEAEQRKQVAIIKAQEDKESEEILKQKKELEGQGDRIRAEEQAKGNAAKLKEEGLAQAEAIKAKGLAEAEAKNKLQEALNKFGDKAIQALVAEKIVDKDKEVGVAYAGALQTADLKIFAGGEDAKQGFNLGKMLSSMKLADEDTADAALYKMMRPNDLGFQALALKEAKDVSDNKTSINKEETENNNVKQKPKSK